MADVLLRIGEFARLIPLPVRTVRYYADIGLLPPSATDPATGYRRYELALLDRARRLLALRAMGLALDEIGPILDDELSPDRFRAVLEAHVAELEAERARLDERLRLARACLAQQVPPLSVSDQHRSHPPTPDLSTPTEEAPMTDITIITTEPKRIASLRDRLTTIEQIPDLFPRLFDVVDPTVAVGPAALLYHHFAEDGSDIDLEAVLPIPDDTPTDAFAERGVEVRTLEPLRVATYTHHGSFNRLHEAHERLLRWIDDHDFEVVGPSYEWNIVCTPPVTQDDESYVTEIHIEIAERT